MKKATNTSRISRTDWARIDAMKDEDIDYSDAPKLGPDFFANAVLWPGLKEQITLRIDPDVLTFFRKHGRGYQSMINAVLRKYMEARKSAVRVSLVAGPKDPSNGQEGAKLQPRMQAWLNSDLAKNKLPSKLLPAASAWLQKGRGRRIRFEIDANGKVIAKEVKSKDELEGLIGSGNTPEGFLRALGSAAL